MRYLEILLWCFGVLLAAAFLGAETWGRIEQQRGISEFATARQQTQQDARPGILRAGARDDVAPPADTSTTGRTTTGRTAVAILKIPEIDLEVPVNYGTTENVLRRGAGLIQGSAAPGTRGNIAIAAHRDTFFEGLEHVALGDVIEVQTMERSQTYRVSGLWVVEPDDVQVLADNGEPTLTLVTCYPFRFVGSAPQRYVVRAVAGDLFI